MARKFGRMVLGAWLVLGSILGSQGMALAEKPQISAPAGIAIRGYDPVAYFTEGRPVEGSAAFAWEWKGAVWHFASVAHRDLFKADPEKYAPQFGGYCAFGVAQGHTPDSDPTLWRIVNGKLYLNLNARAQELWLRDIDGNVAKANQNWPSVLSQ